MTVIKSPPTLFPAFAWPKVDTAIAPPQLANQLNTRMTQLQATLGSLTTVAQGTENWTHVVSTTYPAKLTDQTLALDATNGNVSAVLPVSQNAPGKVYTVIRTDASGHTATVTLQGADLFEPGGATTLTATTAGQQVQSDGQGHWWITANVSSGGGGGAVSSVFTRTGAVTAQTGDYTVSQVTGAAPLASPAFTGTPTAPTQTAGSNNTDIATTAYVDGSFLPLAGGALTGAVTSLNALYPALTLGNGGAAASESSSVMVSRVPSGKFAWDMFRQDPISNTPSWVLFEAYSSGTTRALIGQIAASSTGMLFIAQSGFGFSFAANGSFASPQMTLNSSGNLLLAGILSQFQGQNTAGTGLAPTLGAVDTTGQSASISGASIMTTPGSGTMVVTTVYWCATITTAATTSCTLGGATGFQLTYTDFATSTAQTINCAITSGTATTNSAGASISGVATVLCKASTSLTYNFGYTSSGATAMVYRIDIRAAAQG